MKTLLFSCIFIVAGCVGRGGDLMPPTPVKHVELERYLGDWYAVARIPNRFERDCLQSEARYTPTNDPHVISVLNRCPTSPSRLGEQDRSWKEVTGKAWVKNPPANSMLEVGFFSILGWHPPFARGQYWILDLGPLNESGQYSYAVVGESSRRYGWILGRERVLSDSLSSKAFAAIRTQGYDPTDFEMLGSLESDDN